MPHYRDHFNLVTSTNMPNPYPSTRLLHQGQGTKYPRWTHTVEHLCSAPLRPLYKSLAVASCQRLLTHNSPTTGYLHRCELDTSFLFPSRTRQDHGCHGFDADKRPCLFYGSRHILPAETWRSVRPSQWLLQVCPMLSRHHLHQPMRCWPPLQRGRPLLWLGR